MAVFQDFIVNQAIGFCVPVVANYVKPYLTPGAEKLVCTELKALADKVTDPQVKGYAEKAVAALAQAFGV